VVKKLGVRSRDLSKGLDTSARTAMDLCCHKTGGPTLRPKQRGKLEEKSYSMQRLPGSLVKKVTKGGGVEDGGLERRTVAQKADQEILQSEVRRETRSRTVGVICFNRC